MSHEQREAQRHPQSEPPANSAPALCPYCGGQSSDPDMCDACAGLFEPLSRQATQNAMGPWFVRDEAQPFRPGCAYATLKRLVLRGVVRADTIIRGPTTRQFWSRAAHTPGVAHLLGACHNCQGSAEPDEYMCRACGAVFVAPTDRQSLGLAPVRLLPGEAPPEVIAETSMSPRPLAPPPPRSAPAPLPTTTPQPTTPFSTPPHAPKPPLPALAPAEDLSIQRLSREVGSLKTVVLTLAVVAAVLMLAIVLLLLRTTPPAAPSPAPVVEPAPTVPLPAPTGTDWPARMASAIELGKPGTPEALRESLDALQAIERDVPASKRPAGLDEAIAGLRARLDAENIRKFMESPGL